jgi:hypothetical protein
MIGRVHLVNGKTAMIAPEGSFCFGCMNSECGSHIPALFQAENPHTLPLKSGQIVETALSPALIRQGLPALLPLPAGFAAGFCFAGLLFPAGGEAFRAAAGVLLMLISGLACYLVRRHFPPRTQAAARIKRIIGG